MVCLVDWLDKRRHFATEVQGRDVSMPLRSFFFRSKQYADDNKRKKENDNMEPIYSFPYSSAGVASPSVFFFLFFFLSSRNFFVNSVLSSSSSSSFSVLTSSGLYHIGACVINDGPPGSSAIVKWKAATKVFAGV